MLRSSPSTTQIGWLRPEFGPAFEGSQLLAGCSLVEAKNPVSLRKTGKWTFGMPLHRLSVRLAWFECRCERRGSSRRGPCRRA